MEVKIYTDGAARGNPDGPGGYGTILEYVDRTGTLHTKELSQGYVKTTNNRMELMAVIAGLEALVRVIRHPALCHLPFCLETPNDLPGYAREIALMRQAAM